MGEHDNEGNAVMLRGGGHRMTIMHIGIAKDFWRDPDCAAPMLPDTPAALCAWHDNDGHPQEEVYPLRALVLVPGVAGEAMSS